MIFWKSKGFSLIELIVTMAVAAILIIMVVPGFYGMIQNNKVVTMANNFASAINLARIESIKRGIKISLCPAANSANTACGNASQWAQGWIIFADSDNNNAIDTPSDLLKVYEPLPLGTNVVASAAIISFDSSGFLLNGPFTMTLKASGCYGSNGRKLEVISSGRFSVSRTAC